MKIKLNKDNIQENTELNEYRTKGAVNKPKEVKEIDVNGNTMLDANPNKTETPEEQQEYIRKAKKGFCDHSGIVEMALDDALYAAKAHQRNSRRAFTNVALAGEPGTGKTSRFYAWCEDVGVTPLYIDIKNKDATDFAGIFHADEKTQKTQRYATTSLDDLDRPNSVLFLDEFNRGYPEVRGTLLTLIQDHKIEDETKPGHIRYFPNLLFTVIAYNPSDTDDTIVNDIGAAEGTRFRRIDVPTESGVTYNYLVNNFENYIKEVEEEKYEGWEEDVADGTRILNLVNALFSSSVWKSGDNQLFDTAEERNNIPTNRKNATNARTLEALLNTCRGYKDKFIKMWSEFCNPEKKDLIIRALSTYKEVDDKANDAIHSGPKGHIDSLGERARKYLNSL